MGALSLCGAGAVSVGTKLVPVLQPDKQFRREQRLLPALGRLQWQVFSRLSAVRTSTAIGQRAATAYLLLDPTGTGYTIPAGLESEGALIAFSNSWQLVVAGLDTEYVLSIPVPQMVGTSVIERGLQSAPAVVPVALNPLYSAEDQHVI